VVEPSKYDALSLNPSTTKNKRKERKKSNWVSFHSGEQCFSPIGGLKSCQPQKFLCTDLPSLGRIRNLSCWSLAYGSSVQKLVVHYFTFFFFCSTGGWTHGLMLASRHTTTWATPPALVLTLEGGSNLYSSLFLGFFSIEI
jgi:hypothetical protein